MLLLPPTDNETHGLSAPLKRVGVWASPKLDGIQEGVSSKNELSHQQGLHMALQSANLHLRLIGKSFPTVAVACVISSIQIKRCVQEHQREVADIL